jgi:hypothetical protein
VKIGETSLDRFYRFLINRIVNLIFSKKIDFLKKWFTSFGTGLPVISIEKLILPTGLSVLAYFNHYRPIGFGIDLSVIPINTDRFIDS